LAEISWYLANQNWHIQIYLLTLRLREKTKSYTSQFATIYPILMFQQLIKHHEAFLNNQDMFLRENYLRTISNIDWESDRQALGWLHTKVHQYTHMWSSKSSKEGPKTAYLHLIWIIGATRQGYWKMSV
jgi:hypothetical protein